jgi:hypothetical protein
MSATEGTKQQWTQEELTTFTQKLTSFRDDLPPRQRDAFNAIMTAAGKQVAPETEDVQGYWTVEIPKVVTDALGPARDTLVGKLMSPKQIEEQLKKGKGTPPA